MARLVTKSFRPNKPFYFLAAIWLLPELQAYGNAPLSGKIALMESRSNKNLVQKGINIGSEQYATTLHWGPDPRHNAWKKTHFLVNSPPGQGFDKEFHNFQMEWTRGEKLILLKMSTNNFS